MSTEIVIQRNLTVLRDYFSNYQGFVYNENAAPTSEFDRMCKQFGWKRKQPARKEACQLFQDALTKQFNSNFGTDANSLEAWKNLCAKLNVDPIPTTLKECRKIVTNTHANLVDLVQGEAVIFSTVFELSAYTKEEGKIFPRKNIHAGDLLKHLLRHISNPSLDANRGSKSRGRKRRGN